VNVNKYETAGDLETTKKHGNMSKMKESSSNFHDLIRRKSGTPALTNVGAE
jgi:hypothetical protein